MLSLTTAKALHDAGLAWTPAELDFFAIPLPGFEDQVFAISNMTVLAEPIRETLALTFHGVAEWTLDHIWAGEAIWLPREDQLRELVEERLVGQPGGGLCLDTVPLGYRCEARLQGQTLAFEAFDASEAYGAALLHLLATESRE
jgi:hypothetical protein